jgi:hypothetical protein
VQILFEHAQRGLIAGRAESLGTDCMFEHFTEQAIKVIMLAQEEARRLGHSSAGTEQILIGLLAEENGVAAKILKQFDVRLGDARREVVKIIGHGSGFVPIEIPFTPRATRVFSAAWEESKLLGRPDVATEHLLLGLLREGGGVAIRVLENLNINLPNLQKEVVERLKNTVTPSPETESKTSWTALSQAKLLQRVERAPLWTGLAAISPGWFKRMLSGAQSGRPLEPKDISPRRIDPVGSMNCPHCSEPISIEAVVCFHCKYGISDQHFVECNYCSERIRKGATKCRYCKNMLQLRESQ